MSTHKHVHAVCLKGWNRRVINKKPKPNNSRKHRNFTLGLGSCFRAGADRQFGLRKSDSVRHMFVVGKTGMGKSTMVENICIQLISRNQGFTVVDPHGDSISVILKNVTNERTKDTLLFSLADTEFPFTYNPLANIPTSDRATKAASLTRAIANIWRDSWGERSQYILQYAVLSLLYAPNASLMDISRLFDDESYRERVIQKCNQDPGLETFWRAFNGWTERYRSEAIGPLQNKLGQLFMHPAVRNILCCHGRSEEGWKLPE